MLANSFEIVAELEAGTTNVALSAYLIRALPGVMVHKSAELRMNIVGPKADPWTTLALIFCSADNWDPYFVR